MAGGLINTHASDVKHYPGKITLHVFLTCLIAATGGLMFGYDIGISGGVTSMDSFLRKFFPAVYRKEKGESRSTKQYCKFDSQVLTLFTSSLYLAALIASFFASAITRRFGRNCSMFAGGAIFLIGAALNGAAENVAMLIVGRVLLGIGVAFTTQMEGGDPNDSRRKGKGMQSLISKLIPRKKKLTSGPHRDPVTTTPSSSPHVTPPAPSPVYDSPSDSRHFHGETSQPAAGTDPSDSRIFIVPDGDTFHPAQQPIHKIRDIIRANFNEPYLSWQMVPNPVRDMWFREFASSFSWMPEDEVLIRRNFNRKTSSRFRDMFTYIRKSEERPLWIRESVWNELCRMWATPEYQKKREQNQANRKSETDEPLHRGGSIPNTQHSRRLKEVLGREPTTLELHTRTHQSKETEEWITRKSKHVHDEYMRLKEISSQSCAAEAGGSTASTDFDLWNQAVGGKKKGRLYGLGAKGYAFDEPHRASFAGSTFQEAVKREVAKMSANFNDEMMVMRARVDKLEAERRGRHSVEEEQASEETETDQDDEDDEDDE